MKKIITFLIVLLGFTISFASTPDTVSVSNPTEIAQLYFPGVHYSHKTFIADRRINGVYCYAYWYVGWYNNGVRYYYFYWQPY